MQNPYMYQRKAEGTWFHAGGWSEDVLGASLFATPSEDPGIETVEAAPVLEAARAAAQLRANRLTVMLATATGVRCG